MASDLWIGRPSLVDKPIIEHVFETSISDAYEQEGIGYLKEELHAEIQHKKLLLETVLYQQDSSFIFLIAKRADKVVGTILYGPCNDLIKTCTR